MRRELLGLVLAVVVVDAIFIAGYFLIHFERASASARLAYTAGWMAITLTVVLRALTRIRRLRRHR